jgi:hypothetical protein
LVDAERQPGGSEVEDDQADELESIVSEIEDGALALRDLVATLQDEDTKGAERRDKTGEVEEAFSELCSNVRALSRELGLPVSV